MLARQVHMGCLRRFVPVFINQITPVVNCIHLTNTGMTIPGYIHTHSTNFNASSPAQVQSKGTVNLSERCIKQLNRITSEGSMLRISVEGGGCSGFQYKFELDDQQNDDDQVFGEGNARVIIDNDT